MLIYNDVIKTHFYDTFILIHLSLKIEHAIKTVHCNVQI